MVHVRLLVNGVRIYGLMNEVRIYGDAYLWNEVLIYGDTSGCYGVLFIYLF